MLLDLILPWPVGFASEKDLLPLMSLALVTSSLEDSPLILLEGGKSKGRLVASLMLFLPKKELRSAPKEQ